MTALDPSDNCTFWYVGDYIKEGAAGYSTKIGRSWCCGLLRLRRRLTNESGRFSLGSRLRHPRAR